MITNVIERQRSFYAIHLATSFKIDVFTVKSRPFDQCTITRIRPDTLVEFGVELPVLVASPEDVILNELEWYRKGNEISERQWEDILGVMRIQARNLDRTYLSEWATTLNVDDLLDRAWQQIQTS